MNKEYIDPEMEVIEINCQQPPTAFSEYDI